MLPKRKPTMRVMNSRPDSGPLRSPGHLAFVRSHDCCLRGKEWLEPGLHVPHVCSGPIEAAHVRTGTDGSLGAKPGDDWTISLCAYAHRRQHEVGETSFEKHWRIDMKKLAEEFAAKSPPLQRLRMRKP